MARARVKYPHPAGPTTSNHNRDRNMFVDLGTGDPAVHQEDHTLNKWTAMRTLVKVETFGMDNLNPNLKFGPDPPADHDEWLEIGLEVQLRPGDQDDPKSLGTTKPTCVVHPSMSFAFVKLFFNLSKRGLN